MDVYGLPSSSGAECFPIDDLLDFPNDDDHLFSASTITSSDTATITSSYDTHLVGHQNKFSPPQPSSDVNPSSFADDLCVPNDEVAQLEWLSQFVEDSFTHFPLTDVAAFPPETSSISGRSSRCSGSTTTDGYSRSRSSASLLESPTVEKTMKPTVGKDHRHILSGGGVRRCAHCASEKTPQWRSGPQGPKTLCNACGVRYKSGRLVPEYRPAASPTFVLTQHSNSHRKVLELRRKKEVVRQQHQRPLQEGGGDQQQEQFYPHPHDFQVC